MALLTCLPQKVFILESRGSECAATSGTRTKQQQIKKQNNDLGFHICE